MVRRDWIGSLSYVALRCSADSAEVPSPVLNVARLLTPVDLCAQPFGVLFVF